MLLVGSSGQESLVYEERGVGDSVGREWMGGSGRVCGEGVVYGEGVVHGREWRKGLARRECAPVLSKLCVV